MLNKGDGMRPQSIVRYELCYLGAILFGIAATALAWSASLNTKEMKQIQAVLGSSFVPIFYVFIYTLSLALWYFTARVPNAAARLIVTGWFVLSAIGVAFSLTKGAAVGNLPGLLSVAAIVFNGVAVWFLYRPDARAWFGGRA